MNSHPRVSVIINTCDRGAYLGDTLEGLKQQTYKNFEVIVVNGPSQDNTEEVAKHYNVRYYTAPYNISVSRNVGIRHAAGEILAFIDDDAVPEPNWIRDLVDGYKKNPDAGAVGGFVYNHDGSWFQFCYGAIDKWGYPMLRWDKPYNYNSPKAHYYNINIGTNASYLRKALVEIGGFDEEIEYYHDESDVCVRIIKNGYKVLQLNNAYVHHKMAPSSRRNGAKQVTNWDAVVKNSIYFGVKHSKGIAPTYKRIIRPAYTEFNKFLDMLKLLFEGKYTPWQYLVRTFSLVRSMYRGYKRGFFEEPKLLKNYKFEAEKFRLYTHEDNKSDILDIVLVSQGYPPTSTDGISRYNHTLAKELAERGHRIYVVTKSPEDKTNIFYREKHWVYYTSPSLFPASETGFGRTDNILSMNKSVYATTLGICKKGKVDIILTPLWDVEGLILERHKLAPTILTLMSPLKKVVETQWSWVDDPSIDTVYELEEYCIREASGIMAISNAIKQTIGEAYELDWKELERDKPVKVIPLGVDEKIAFTTIKSKPYSNVRVLYVGRFEKRKGIDLLLDVIPDLLKKYSNLEFHLIGNQKIRNEEGKLYFEEFKKLFKNEKWFNRVFSYGYISDEELASHYEECDIFVAPSRYESFGIIFIEAMAHAKPVIGANVGGIPEIIADGLNGFLFLPENSDDLKDKIEKLILNKKLRLKMGANSKKILEDKFSASLMADNFITFTKEVIQKDEHWNRPSTTSASL